MGQLKCEEFTTCHSFSMASNQIDEKTILAMLSLFDEVKGAARIDLASVILQDGSLQSVALLLQNKSCPTFVIDKVARSLEVEFRLLAASHKKLSALSRDKLLSDKSSRVRQAAADNAFVTGWVAPSTKLTASMSAFELEYILNNSSSKVTSGSIDLDILKECESFSGISDYTLCDFIAVRSDRVEACRVLAPYMSFDQILSILYQCSEEDRINKEIFSIFSPFITAEDLKRSAKSYRVFERLMVANHPLSLSEEVNRLAGDEDEAVAIAAALHKNAELSAAVAFAARDDFSEKGILTVLGKFGPEAAVPMLSSSYFGLLQECIENSKSKIARGFANRGAVLEIGSNHRFDYTRFCVASAPDIEPVMGIKLLSDVSADVRRAAACNLSTPIESVIAAAKISSFGWKVFTRFTDEQLREIPAESALRFLAFEVRRGSEVSNEFAQFKRRLKKMLSQLFTEYGISGAESFRLVFSLGESFEGSVSDLIASCASLSK